MTHEANPMTKLDEIRARWSLNGESGFLVPAPGAGDDLRWLVAQAAEAERLRAALRPFAAMARPGEKETRQGHGEALVTRGYASDLTILTSGDIAAAGRAMWPEHGCDPEAWGPQSGGEAKL